MANILVFGDSVTYGAWDKEGGWVHRLRRIIEEQSYKQIVEEKHYELESKVSLIYNLGISDETTKYLLDRFENEIKARLWENDTIIIMIGKNDAIFDNENKTFAVPPQEFEANMKQLIGIAKKYAKHIILMETLPVDDKRVDPIPWLKGHSYKNEYIDQYNQTIRKVSKEENTALIEIYSALIKTDFVKILEDGLHPNGEGHKFICDQVKQYLLNNHIIEL